MELSGENYTVVQLREWLKTLKQKSTGNKEELLQRLKSLPQEIRGDAPPGCVEDDDYAECENSSMSVMYRRELDMAKRENDLLVRELELVKRFATVNIEHPVLESNNGAPTVPISLSSIKDLLPEFNGESNFEFWAKQFQSIGNMYNLNQNMMRVLLTSRCTGNALKWLHENVNFAEYTVEQLLHQMSEIFSSKQSKLIVRKKFEQRKWVFGEQFLDYFNEKISLSNALKIDEEELIDYLIDGIPDQQLKTQALLQCFETKQQLLQAFIKVQLQERTPKQKTTAIAKTQVRCYNCNDLGHFAGQCLKPKREVGSCYGCGGKDHKVNVCPQRKAAISAIEQNDYVNFIKFYFNNNNNDKFCVDLETLIDSGSPISLIRNRCLPFQNELDLLYSKQNMPNFYGLNKSKLHVFGKISCVASINSFNIPINLLVVADDSMSYDIILGRDFLQKTNSKLVYRFSNVSQSTQTDNLINVNNDDLDIVMYPKIEQISVKKCDIKDESAIDGVSWHNNSLVCIKVNHNAQKFKEETIIRDNFANNDSVKNENEFKENFVNNTYDTELKDFETSLMAIVVEDVETVSLNVNSSVAWNYKQKLNKLFDEDYLIPARPKLPTVKSELRLVLNNDKPFSCCPRRIAYSERAELQKLLENYLEKGYIRPSSSEYASAIVLVRKKTGELRMCIDFRNLNKITSKDNYPIPLIDDLLEKLARKTIFSKLDLKDGFFHVFMHPDSVKLTSFVTPLGQFEFLRMPFGLKNAPSMFQRFVNTIFADMVKNDQIIIYLDDIMIATNSFEEHFEILKEVFRRLVNNKLELRPDKCEFLQSSIKYLGYTISGEGVQADEEGLQAIKDFPIPTKVHNVQSFLGLCSYFRRFIRNFSTVAKPLYDLTKKNVKFKFEERELECFQILKTKLLKSPVLALYDYTRETELHCDASALGFGAILMQKGDDNKFHAVFYFSKRTSDAESKYHSFELETLAIIYALKRFRIYLQGIQFKIVTDCNSLALTLNKKEINPRIARWALELQNFDYTLEHRSNSRMQHVDALSRCSNILVVETNNFEENLVICQNKDNKIKLLKAELEKTESSKFEMRNGIVYKKDSKGKILFYVPELMEKQVIFKYHDEMGHIGVEKTVELISKTYWFPKFKSKILDHVNNCLKCIIFSPKRGREEGFLHNIPKGNKPFEFVHIDHYGPVDKEVKVKKYILVVIDAFTKFVRLYCTKTTKTSEVILALSDYFRAYSRPKFIISDRGSSFTSSEFKEFLNANNVNHIKVATASPQGNGQVERVNRNIGPMLGKLVDSQNGIEWYKVIDTIEFVLNNSIHKSTGEHPSVLLFGINQRRKETDLLSEELSKIIDKVKQTNIKQIRNSACAKQRKAQIYNKKYVDKKRQKPTKYKVDDYVLIRNFDSHIGVSKKLIPKFKGPYKIFKVLRNDRYILKDVDGFQNSQVPYIGTWAVGNMRPWIGNKTIEKKKIKK